MSLPGFDGSPGEKPGDEVDKYLAFAWPIVRDESAAQRAFSNFERAVGPSMPRNFVSGNEDHPKKPLLRVVYGLVPTDHLSPEDRRNEFIKFLSNLQRGDQLLVLNLNRLADNLDDLGKMFEELEKRGIEFGALEEKIDTIKPEGKNFYRHFRAIAGFEKAASVTRTHQRAEKAHANGSKFGPKHKLTPEQVEKAQALICNHQPTKEVAAKLKISRTTLWRARRKAKSPQPDE
jgi:Resolvase, N terminal domain